MNNTPEIHELTEAEKIAQAVAEGYPDVDETCSQCGAVFKNYHHFIRCDRENCPIRDGGPTLLERLLAECDKPADKGAL